MGLKQFSFAIITSRYKFKMSQIFRFASSHSDTWFETDEKNKILKRAEASENRMYEDGKR